MKGGYSYLSPRPVGSGGVLNTDLTERKNNCPWGSNPDVTLKTARDRREEARKLLANDIDPSENRKAKKLSRDNEAGNSFEVVAREWFSTHSPNWSAGHANRILRRLERDIFPWIGSKPITGIEAPELLSVIRRIENRGALETAHRALGNCGQVFRYAIATGRAKNDPSGDLRGALPPLKERTLRFRYRTQTCR